MSRVMSGDLSCTTSYHPHRTKMIKLNTKESLKEKAWTNVLHDVHENVRKNVYNEVRYKAWWHNVEINVKSKVRKNVMINVCTHLTKHTKQI
jgi:hypothetical protein